MHTAKCTIIGALLITRRNMQGNNSVQGGSQSGSNKQGGLSWSQPATSGSQSFSSSPAKLSSTSSKPSTANVTKAPQPASRSGLIGGFIGGLILGALLAWGWFALKPASTPVATNTDNSQMNTGTNSDNSGAVTNNPSTSGSGNTAVPPTNSGSGAVKGVPVSTNNSITIPTQTAGTKVTVSALSVAAPTWIVIYDNNNGQPGKALGAGLVFPTTKAPIAIDLLRPTIAGQTYIVGQRLDDGDHKYSSQTDKLVTDESGKPMWLQFQTN